MGLFDQFRVAEYVMHTTCVFDSEHFAWKREGCYCFRICCLDDRFLELLVPESNVRRFQAHAIQMYQVYFTEDMYSVRVVPNTGMESVQLFARDVLCDLLQYSLCPGVSYLLTGLPMQTLSMFACGDQMRELSYLTGLVSGHVYAKLSVPMRDLRFYPKLRPCYGSSDPFLDEYLESCELESWFGLYLSSDTYTLVYKNRQTNWKESELSVTRKQLARDLLASIRASHLGFSMEKYQELYQNEWDSGKMLFGLH